MTERTTRRRVLAAVGASAAAALAGCTTDISEETTTESTTQSTTEQTTEATSTAQSTNTTQGGDAAKGPRHGDDLPEDPNPKDGYPPEFDESLPERDVDTSSFETMDRNGFEVSLVPIDVAYYWFVRGEARFADTRSETAYEESHVLGAVHSPAGDGEDDPDDPVLDWPEDERILTYCACPHHLSTLRAASLQNRGYTNVYAIDEGYTPWQENSYPMGGSNPSNQPEVRTIAGETDTEYAGESAWAYHPDSGQREATSIRTDGSYELHLKFVDVTERSEIRVETPGYSVTADLASLVTSGVTASGDVGAAGGSASLRSFWRR